MILMTKCPECGIDKEAVWKDIQKLEAYIKMLTAAIENDPTINNWSSKLGQMVKAMDEEKKDA